MNNLASSYLSELLTPYTQNRYPTKEKFQNRLNNPTIFRLKLYMVIDRLLLWPQLNGTNCHQKFKKPHQLNVLSPS